MITTMFFWGLLESTTDLIRFSTPSFSKTGESDRLNRFERMLEVPRISI